MYFIYTNFIYNPLYNGLIFLANILPWLDAGVIVIIFTIIVKIILFPISKKAVRTQAIMKLLEPELNALKTKYPDKQEQAKRTMQFYKDKKINPFSSILLLFIQLPILIALYWIFYSNGLSTPNVDLLYPFVKDPQAINTVFLGIVDVTQKSYVLAFLAAVSQFFQIQYSIPKIAPRKEKPSLTDDLARNMQLQMKYVLPVVIFFISYQVSGALALYWTASNLFMIGQEVVVRRQLAKELNKEVGIKN